MNIPFSKYDKPGSASGDKMTASAGGTRTPNNFGRTSGQAFMSPQAASRAGSTFGYDSAHGSFGLTTTAKGRNGGQMNSDAQN